MSHHGHKHHNVHLGHALVNATKRFSSPKIDKIVSGAIKKKLQRTPTHTRTMTKKNRKSRRDIESTGDMNKVEYSAKKLNRKVLKKNRVFKKKVDAVLNSELPIQRTLSQVGFRATAAAGFQQQFIIPVCDVSNMRTVLQEIDQTVFGITDENAKIQLLNYHQSGFYTNMSTGVVIMDWYKVYPRCDNINSPDDDLANALQTNLEGSAAGGVNVQTTTAQTFGITPFMATEYCRKWLIKEKRRIIIQPGEVKEFTSHNKKNITWDYKRTQQGGTYYEAVRGYTWYWHVLIYGQPAQDSITPNNVSSGPASIDVTYVNQYTSRAVPSPTAVSKVSQSKIYVANQFAAVPTPKVQEEFTPGSLLTDVIL